MGRLGGLDLLSQGRGVDAYWLAGAGCGVPFVGEADLLGDALGWHVVRVGDRDEPFQVESIAGVVAAGGGCFGGIAVALEVGADVVADLDVGSTLDFLGC